MRWARDEQGIHTRDGLLGASVLDGRRLFLDTASGTFALRPSPHLPVFRDGRRHWLKLNDSAEGGDLSRTIERANASWWIGERNAAIAILERAEATAPDQAALHVQLIRYLRYEGRSEDVVARLAALNPQALIELKVLDELVLTAIAHDEVELASAWIEALAVHTSWDEARARAHVALAHQDARGARRALDRGVPPSAHDPVFVLTRALIALTDGDRAGALALWREVALANPTHDLALLAYADLARPADVATLLTDARVMASQTHPSLLPWAAHAWTYAKAGQADLAADTARHGIEATCAELPVPDRRTCRASIAAAARTELDTALRGSQRALREEVTPERLHTLARVLMARGERTEAEAIAAEALRRAPTDVSIRWTLSATRSLAVTLP